MVNNFAKDAGCLSVFVFTATMGSFAFTSCTTRLRVLIGIPCSARILVKLCGNSLALGAANNTLLRKILTSVIRINFWELSLAIRAVVTKAGSLLVALLEFRQFFRTGAQVLKRKFIERSFNCIFIFNKICLAFINIKQTR